jgi:hypothetical protein
MLPLAQTVNALPPLFAAPWCAQIYAQILGAPSRKLSPVGGATEKSEPPQALGISVFDGDGRAGAQLGGVGEMVRDAGFEPAAHPLQRIADQLPCCPCQGRYAQIYAQLAADPDWARVAHAWPRIGPAFREAIVALIQAAEQSSRA